MGQLGRMIGDFRRFLRSTPGPANLFAIAALLLWIVKSVYFDAVPEIFPKAYEMGKVFEGLLSAIVAGWVFFLFFALLPEYRDRRAIAPHILRKVTGIVADCKAVLREVSKVAKCNLHFALCTHEQLEKALTGISIDSSTLLMSETGARLGWLDFFASRRQRSLAAIEDTMRLSRYIDPRLVSLILETGDNTFFGLARSLESLPHKNMDLGVFAQPLYDYLGLCRRLAAWHDTHTDIIAKPIMVGGQMVSARLTAKIQGPSGFRRSASRTRVPFSIGSADAAMIDSNG